MAIYYTCRHCRTCIGMIESGKTVTRDLGFDRLTSDEHKELILQDPLGNIHVHVTCDICEEAFERAPFLHEIDFIIQ